ncbi:MAG: hypothetical protein QM582_09520 [Micropruina sp.]|uniref:hypothetical protein n=1 Tax=Micropruina sp. TaxID=2737536 RepID=UPI0039E58276
MSSLRERLAVLGDGYRTTVADPVPAVPDIERRAEEKPKRRRPARKRATMAAKQLAPETKEPSPE